MGYDGYTPSKSFLGWIANECCLISSNDGVRGGQITGLNDTKNQKY